MPMSTCVTCVISNCQSATIIAKRFSLVHSQRMLCLYNFLHNFVGMTGRILRFQIALRKANVKLKQIEQKANKIERKIPGNSSLIRMLVRFTVICANGIISCLLANRLNVLLFIVYLVD